MAHLAEPEKQLDSPTYVEDREKAVFTPQSGDAMLDGARPHALS